jgi:hypothetical protein
MQSIPPVPFIVVLCIVITYRLSPVMHCISGFTLFLEFIIMATKKVSPSNVNVPAQPTIEQVFHNVARLIQENTKCPTTLSIVADALATTKVVKGIPGILEDQPADYVAGLAKLHMAAGYACKGKQMDIEVGRSISFVCGKQMGPMTAPVRTAEAMIMSTEYRKGRKSAG